MTETTALRASRAFTTEDRARTWRLLAITVSVEGVFLTGAAVGPHAALRWLSSLAAGLTLVRLFIFFHDFQHGTVLRRSRAAAAFMAVLGWLLLTPASVWRRTHNYHHAHNAELAPFTMGAFLVLSVDQYRQLTPAQRVRYWIERSPINILLAPLTVFGLGMLVVPLLTSIRRHLDVLAVLALHGALVSLVRLAGPHFVVALYVLPLWVASSVGALLFYLQHNAPGVQMFHRGEWTYERSATEACTFLDGGALFHWFTGNIGFHHTHHLNPGIPFYRLPEATDALGLRSTGVLLRLSARDVARCLQCFLWSDEEHRFITRAEYQARAS